MSSLTYCADVKLVKSVRLGVFHLSAGIVFKTWQLPDQWRRAFESVRVGRTGRGFAVAVAGVCGTNLRF